MLSTQCISVTDLRTKTKECLAGLADGAKYIFVNNKPVAVLVDIKEYEELYENFLDFHELDESEITPAMRKKIEQTMKADRSEFTNL